jgi:hypothetical protein
MPRGAPKVQARVVAWWMGGDEECLHCGQLYAYEIEFRCPECDSPACPYCRKQHAEGHHVCPTCVATSEVPADG